MVNCQDCGIPEEDTDMPEFLWYNYGQAEDSTLTKDAIELKKRIRKAICEAVDDKNS